MQQQQQQQPDSPPRTDPPGGYTPDKIQAPKVQAADRVLHGTCMGIKTRKFVRDGKTIHAGTVLIYAGAATVMHWGPMKTEDGTDQSGVKAMPSAFAVNFEGVDDYRKLSAVLAELESGELAAFPRWCKCTIVDERPVDNGPTRGQGANLQLGPALI